MSLIILPGENHYDILFGMFVTNKGGMLPYLGMSFMPVQDGDVLKFVQTGQPTESLDAYYGSTAIPNAQPRPIHVQPSVVEVSNVGGSGENSGEVLSGEPGTEGDAQGDNGIGSDNIEEDVILWDYDGAGASTADGELEL